MNTRQLNPDVQEFASIPRDAVSCAATTTFAIFTAQRPFRIDAIELITDATITQDPSNFYALVFRVGGRTVATYSFATGVNGTLTAAAPAPATLAAESGQNRVAAKSDVVDCVATKNGTAANLSNLRFVVHGRYVG
jgi:hypothetical protein